MFIDNLCARAVGSFNHHWSRETAFLADHPLQSNCLPARGWWRSRIARLLRKLVKSTIRKPGSDGWGGRPDGLQVTANSEDRDAVATRWERALLVIRLSFEQCRSRLLSGPAYAGNCSADSVALWLLFSAKRRNVIEGLFWLFDSAIDDRTNVLPGFQLRARPRISF